MVYFKSFLFFLFSLFLAAGYAEEEKRTVLVTVAPHKYFVEQVAGETVAVVVLVPPGASAHTFEPTPRQVLEAGGADIWFQVGEGFEKRAEAAFLSHNPQMEPVNMRKGVRMISDPSHAAHCCHGDMADPHIWLSAKEAGAQAETIAEALAERYPEHAGLYKERLKAFKRELAALNSELASILAGKEGKKIFVSHPAYGYFARDYGLVQRPIEFEGRDPSPRQLTELLQEARKEGASLIFVQPQHSDKGARRLADQLNAKVVVLDPYAENYPENMRRLAAEFADGSDH